jgi:hypothetical protein
MNYILINKDGFIYNNHIEQVKFVWYKMKI